MIRNNINKECRTEDIPQLVIDYFNSFPNVPDTHFIIAGYSSDNKKEQLIYTVNVKSGNITKVDTTSQGATWDGETSTLTRLLCNIAIKDNNGNYIDFPSDEIFWNYFSLQDAVDFARYAVETTIKTMHFKSVMGKRLVFG